MLTYMITHDSILMKNHKICQMTKESYILNANIDNIIEEQGWDDDTLLSLSHDFIINKDLIADFEIFIKHIASIENNL